jgi:hypothetical protein
MHIAQDANFRLNNRARRGKANDPPLQPGSAYMVSTQEVYDYIKDFVNEKEVSASSCCVYSMLSRESFLDTDLCWIPGNSLIEPQAVAWPRHNGHWCRRMSARVLDASERRQPTEGRAVSDRSA